jgi:Domain of unknown function DUF29
MDEILELRQCIEQGRYQDALHIIDEMDEMAQDDKINKIGSYIVILLIHLIKRAAEKRETRSWRNSILNALTKIRQVNKRRSSGGTYMSADALREAIEEHFEEALRNAAEEAFEGMYAEDELLLLLDAEAVKDEAFRLILSEQ